MNHDNSLVIGIDIGTYSSKGVLARLDGTVIATSEKPHQVSMPRPGHVEHDAEEVWWSDFRDITAELLGKADGRVVGVTTSGIGPCSVFCDGAGRPLRPAILYGVDTRAYQEVAELTDTLGEEALLAECGNLLSSQSHGPKFLWTVRNEPHIWERTKYFFTAHTFIAYRLTGEYVLDHRSASMFDPIYSPKTHDWIPEWSELCAPGLSLPELKHTNDVAGYVTAEGARISGLPEGIPIGVGSTDSACEAVSVGVNNPGDAMLMYGSTMVAELIAGDFMRHPNLWACTGPYRGTNTLVGGMSASGSLTTWLKNLVGGTDYGILTQEAADVPAGANGLLALPYFAGERAPIIDPLARGVIAGLTLSTTRGELYRALLEAASFGARHLLESIREAGGVGERYVAVGGGTKGGLWMQIVSDVCGVEQIVPRNAMGASYGDALISAQNVGAADESTSWMETQSTVKPNNRNRALYDELYAQYRDLYPATKQIVHSLAASQISAPAS